MDELTRTLITNICSTDHQVQNDAFFAIIAATDQPVDWAYEAWDGLLADLRDKDNHIRAISAQLLCNLAKSDPQKRMLKDFAALLTLTKDERFVTARHCMQALWKVGVAGAEQQQIFVDGMAGRFSECISEKNGTLIRADILQSMRNVYDSTHAESIHQKALTLIESEDDEKYRKKYAAIWKHA